MYWITESGEIIKTESNCGVDNFCLEVRISTALWMFSKTALKKSKPRQIFSELKN